MDNPFKCSCEIMWMRKFQETKFYRENRDLYCIDDNSKRTALLDMKVPNCGNTLNIKFLLRYCEKGKINMLFDKILIKMTTVLIKEKVLGRNINHSPVFHATWNNFGSFT